MSIKLILFISITRLKSAEFDVTCKFVFLQHQEMNSFYIYNNIISTMNNLFIEASHLCSALYRQNYQRLHI